MEGEELKKIVKEAMQETFFSFGFTIHEPHEIQKDMAHIRSLRLGCEATKRNIIKAFITVTIPAGLYIVWDALKGALK